MARKIKQDGGIVGIVDLIRTTKDANGSFSYPSLIEYLNFLEMNYSDTYYKIGKDLHSTFYENISLNDVKDLLDILDYIFEQKCMRFLKQIQAKPVYKRDENDMAIFNRIYDIFMKSLLNIDTIKKKIESAKQDFAILKNENPGLTDNDILNIVINSLGQYITGDIENSNNMTGGKNRSGSLTCTEIVPGTQSCSDSFALRVFGVAMTLLPRGSIEKGLSTVVSRVGKLARSASNVVSTVYNLVAGSRKKRRVSRKRNSKRISYKPRRISSKRR
jgi:hypothetical protein